MLRAGGSKEKSGVPANIYSISFGSEEYILKLIVMMVIPHYKYRIHNWKVHFKRVNWIICEIFTENKAYVIVNMTRLVDLCNVKYK